MFDQGAFLIILLCLAFCALYLLPSLIAFANNHPSRWLIAVLNAAFGVTVFGWLLLLIWSLHAIHRGNAAIGGNGGESGLNIFANDIKQVSFVSPTLQVPMHNTPELSVLEKVNQIDRLKALVDSGAITLLEFNSMKGQILNR